MRNLVTVGAGDSLLDHVAALGLGYVAGQNLTLDLGGMDLENLDGLLRSRVLLTVFQESGTLTPSTRNTRQEATFRFVRKGRSAHESTEEAQKLLDALWNRRRFSDDCFVLSLDARSARTPSLVVRARDGVALSEFVLSFLVYNKKET